jgi:hypothetical protein
MKSLKAIVLSAVVVMSAGAFAQGPQGGGMGGMRNMPTAQRAQREADRLVEQLGLSADQKAKITELAKTYAVKDSVRMAEVMKQGFENVDRDKMMQDMRTAQTEKANAFKAVLTDAQKTKYDDLLKEQQNRGFGGGAPRQ